MTETRYQLRHVASGRTVDVADNMRIGRNPDSDLVLTEGNPSRRHAELRVQDDGVWLEDLGSANGTFVNGREITAATRLSNGDTIAFDAEQYQVLAEAPAAPVDPNATVVIRRDPPAPARPEPAADEPPASQTRAAPEAPRTPPATPAPEVVKPKADSAHRPGSWADPENQNAQGTRLFNPDELRKLGAGGAGATAASDAGVVDMPYLQIASGSKAGQGLKLQPGGDAGQWSIGSDEGRDIALSDDGVSGLHAKIVNDGARWKLVDQMSANGTFVNGQKSNVSYLRDGDRLRFGPVECVFRLPVGGSQRAQATSRTWVIGAVSFAATVLVLVLAYWLVG